MFVEAHTVGQDDWTTLPDVNGNRRPTSGELRHRLEHAAPVPRPLPVQPDPGRGLHRHGDDRDVERRDGQLERLPGVEGRPDRLQGQAGRGLDHLRHGLARPGARGVRRRPEAGGRRGSGLEASFESGPAAGPAGRRGGHRVQRDVGPASRSGSSRPGRRDAQSLYWGFGLEGVRGAEARAAVIGGSLQQLGSISDDGVRGARHAARVARRPGGTPGGGDHRRAGTPGGGTPPKRSIGIRKSTVRVGKNRRYTVALRCPPSTGNRCAGLVRAVSGKSVRRTALVLGHRGQVPQRHAAPDQGASPASWSGAAGCGRR